MAIVINITLFKLWLKLGSFITLILDFPYSWLPLFLTSIFPPYLWQLLFSWAPRKPYDILVIMFEARTDVYFMVFIDIMLTRPVNLSIYLWSRNLERSVDGHQTSKKTIKIGLQSKSAKKKSMMDLKKDLFCTKKAKYYNCSNFTSEASLITAKILLKAVG